MVEWTTLLHAKDNINGSWIPSSTEQSLCKPLLLSKSTRISYLLLWMHQGLSPPWFITSRGISATLNMKSRLTIKFPKCPTPGKTKFIKFPPSQAGEDVKCLGYAWGDVSALILLVHYSAIGKGLHTSWVKIFCLPTKNRLECRGCNFFVTSQKGIWKQPFKETIECFEV